MTLKEIITQTKIAKILRDLEITAEVKKMEKGPLVTSKVKQQIVKQPKAIMKMTHLIDTIIKNSESVRMKSLSLWPN